MSLLLLVGPLGDVDFVEVDDAKIDAYLSGTLQVGPSAYYRMNDVPRVPSEGSLSLRWRPPEISVAASVVAVGVTTPTTITLGEEEDAVLVFPSSARTTPLQVVGGRNVQAIGGSIALAGSSAQPFMLRFQDVKGSVYLEGLNLNGGGFDIGGITAGGTSGTNDPTQWFKRPDVYIQNCRVTNIHNKAIISLDYPMNSLHIDKLTGTSDAYGIMIAPAKAIAVAYLSRINLSPLAGGLAKPLLLSLLETDDANPSGAIALKPYPVYLDNVNVELGSGLDYSTDWVAPAASKLAAGISVGLRLSVDDTGSWPSATKAYGVVTPGDHADFVGNSQVGLGYTQASYTNLELDAVVGLDGSYALSSKHVFNVEGAIYENSGGHEFGIKALTAQTIKLRDGVGGIASANSVSNPVLNYAKFLVVSAIAAPANAVPAPVISGGGTPPVSTSLAISQGPTGSHWGPDANPVTGQWTRGGGYAGNVTGGPNQWAHAPDFYDASSGINHKFIGGLTSGNTDSDPLIPVAIQRMQEIGIRHIRHGLFGPSLHDNGSFWRVTWQAALQIKNANAIRSPGVQPMTWLWGVGGAPIDGDTRPPYYERTMDAILRPLDGPTVTNPNPTNPYPGTGERPPGTFFDIGWITAGALQGGNEPGGSVTTVGLRGWRWVYDQATKAKLARSDRTVLGGEEYIDATTGRKAPGPANASQLPVFGMHVLATRVGWGRFGDMTDRADITHGAPHRYQGGNVPSDAGPTSFWGAWGASSGAFWSDMEPYNGAAPAVGTGDPATWGKPAGPGRWAKTLPIVMTETGFVVQPSRATSDPQYVPADIGAEYLVRTMVQNYLFGVKRTYYYKLIDEFNGMGICDNQFNRREPFYSWKNMLALVGWEERPGNATPLGGAVTGFVQGAANRIGGAANSAFPNRMDKLELIKPNGEHLIILCPGRTMWDRDTKTRLTPETQNLTYNIPAGYEAHIAEPAKNSMSPPPDGFTYANPNDGTAWEPVGTAGNGFTQTGNTLNIQIKGLTRFIRVRPAVASSPLPTPTVTVPTSGSTVTSSTPTFRGTASTNAADSTDVILVVYQGVGTGGTPVGLMNTQRSGANWGPVTQGAELVDGQYTVQARQTTTDGRTGYSPAITFTIQGLTATPLDSALFVPYSTS